MTTTLQEFVQNEGNSNEKLGFLNIKDATIHQWKELPTDYGRGLSGNRTLDKYNVMRVYYVSFTYRVFKENKFDINGLNLHVIGVVKENNKWKVAFDVVAPTEILIQDGYGFGTEDEREYTNRRLNYIEGWKWYDSNFNNIISPTTTNCTSRNKQYT